MLRAEGLDIYADRLRHTDGVGDLNLALLSVSGENDIPRNLSSHIGTGTVHLGSVFAAHGTTADMSDAAVSVARQLASGDTAVGKRAADNKTSGGIDQLLKIGVQTIFARSQHHDALNDAAEVTDLHIRTVLNGAEESRDLAAVVVEADLRLGIRAALIHAKSDVRALLLHKNLNLRTRIQEVVVSELVETDALEHVVHQLLVVRFVRAGQLTGNDHDSILDENLDGDSGVLVVLEHILWDILKYVSA